MRAMKLGRVANPYSNYLAMIAIDAGAVDAYGGSNWDDAQQVDVGDCGRANAQIERRKWTLKVGMTSGVLAEIGGCGVAGVYRYGDALVIPEHYTGEEDADAEAAFERTIAMHPTTKPVKLGTVDIPSGVLVLKGLFDAGTKIALAKAKKAPQKLSDGIALAVPPGKYDLWTERFRKEPEGVWGSMPSRTRVVPAGTKLKEGAPIADLGRAAAKRGAARGERRIVATKPPWFAVGSMAIANDGRAFAGECGKALRIAAWHADGSFAWESSVTTAASRSARMQVQLVGDTVLAHPDYSRDLFVLDAKTGKRKKRLALPEACRSLLVVGDRIILRPGIETVIASYPAMKVLARFSEQYVNMNAIALAPDAKSFAVTSHEVHVFDLVKAKHVCTWTPTDTIWAATFTPDGKVVTGDAESTVEIRDPATGKRLAMIDAAPGRSNKPTITALAASKKYIAAGREDGCVAVIDRAKKQVVRELDKHHVAIPGTGATSLEDVAFAKDGALWVSAGSKQAPIGLSRYALD
jgi:hypothetical protein